MGQSSLLTRAGLVAVVALGLAGAPAAARDFLYKEWRFNTDAVHGELSAALVASLRAQIDLVESLPIKPDVLDGFRRVPVKVDPETLGGHGFYRAQGGRNAMHRIELGTLIEPPERPLLLRLLLFDYLYERVPDGKRDARLVGWLEDAKRSGAFPYKTLVHNTENFFALGVAAILWDRDPPEARVVRAKLRETLPDFYAWVVAAFYPAGEPAH